MTSRERLDRVVKRTCGRAIVSEYLGPYTGEVSPKQIKEFAEYVLIGHSERRQNFGETNEAINQKIEKAIFNNLKPIVCVSDTLHVESLTSDKVIISYEPIEAIGTGKPDDPTNSNLMAKKIKDINSVSKVIYGGSVNSDNINKYTSQENLGGVLVGGESLAAISFLNIINNAI